MLRSHRDPLGDEARKVTDWNEKRTDDSFNGQPLSRGYHSAPKIERRQVPKSLAALACLRTREKDEGER